MHHFTSEELLDQVSAELEQASQLIDQLHQDGYTMNFMLSRNQWMCLQNKQHYLPCEVRVDEIYRFDDDSGILNGLFIYAVTECWDGLKGILIIDLTNDDHRNNVGEFIM